MSMPSHLQVWMLAIRPRTLIASLSPTFIGAALSMGQGVFDGGVLMMTLLTGLSIQIGSNLANDYFDSRKGVHTPEEKRLPRVTQKGFVTPQAMRRALFLSLFSSCVCGSYLIGVGGPPIAALLALYLILSFLYTAGPYPLGYRGWGDLLVFLFYGPGAVLITYYLQTHTLSKEALLAGCSPGAFSLALLVLNNLRDLEEDRAVGKKTLPVRLGKVAGKIEFFLAVLCGFLPLLLLMKEHPFCALAFLALLPALPLLRALALHQDPALINPLFKKTSQLLWLFTFLFFVGCIL